LQFLLILSGCLSTAVAVALPLHPTSLDSQLLVVALLSTFSFEFPLHSYICLATQYTAAAVPNATIFGPQKIAV